ncbi:KaiC domain-containing protein [Methanosphaerula palustris]|uniref:Putative circadian clock protein, KaiC n=1 Tax=Methanosphaerula palustris (strain ATCC BAA-1556 / DSM 19958 / E1-9c) TaxID=521011 RepID=B8GFS0_METPE|nr:KaiC domain-containing protein [Methanosphaerula palustris]ACL17953.1 putative circadian clock protein, KaiC [Methanosphaerula palustris E1-9c]
MSVDEERVRMGIDGLDEMLSGGLIPGSFAAIVGTYGTGKTTFALQFIWEGLIRGETAIYITLEESEESIVRYMQVKSWDIDQYRNTTFFVLKLDPTNFNLSINSIRNDLPPLIKKYNAKRVVFDPISLFEDLFDTDSARRHELFRFVDMLRSEDCTVLMTSEADKDNQYSSRHNLIEYLVDTVILLRYIRSNESSQVHLALEVVKMRLSAHSREIKPYEILSDRVNVYSEANVF